MKAYFKYFTILGALLIFGFNDSFAQKGTILDKKNNEELDKKLAILNEHLGGTCEINVKKYRLEMNFLENNEPYRIDYAYIETLDPNEIYYSEEEDAVIVKCRGKKELKGKLKKFSDGCIERHILKNKVIRAYYRINFEVSGDKQEFIDVFKEIVEAMDPEREE